jgi:hypothetical protein
MKLIPPLCSGAYHYSSQRKSLLSWFLNWCESGEKYCIGRLAAITGSQGGLITTVTLFFVMTKGNHLGLRAFGIVSMGMVLVTNFSALTPRITIPVCFPDVLFNMIVILNCFI